MNSKEIWQTSLPYVNGHEQTGVRPVLILSDIEADTVIMVPFTSNTNSLRYLSTLQVDASPQNGLNTESIALVFQIRVIDIKRCIQKIGILEDEYYNDILTILKRKVNL